MINLICDVNSWAELLRQIPEKQRFSMPTQYDQDLLDKHGRPLAVTMGGSTIMMHIYPPGRDRAVTNRIPIGRRIPKKQEKEKGIPK